MIDWTKPIETVPCAINPLPVPCEFVGFGYDGSARVRVLGDWFSSEDQHQWDNHRDEPDSPCWYANRETGNIQFSGHFIPLRNVAENTDA